MADLKFLAMVEVCEGMDVHQLDKILSCCRTKTYSPGERVFAEGGGAEDLCFVVKGRVDLRFDLPGRSTSKETTISTVSRGGMFGWSALVPPHRYTLSSYCSGDKNCTLLCLKRDELTALFEDDPRLGYLFMRNLARVIGQRFNALQDDFARESGLELMSSGKVTG